MFGLNKEIARDELREEGGYDCPIEKIYTLGKIFCTTQSSEHVYLFLADCTGLEYIGMSLDKNEDSWRHYNEWVDLTNDLALKIEDPRALAILFRLQSTTQLIGSR